MFEANVNEKEGFDPGIADDLYLDRNPEYGGVHALLSGIPGCGKTNATVRILKTAMEEYDDRILWRGTRDCEWNRFIHARTGSVPVKVWLHQNVSIQMMMNRDTGEELSLESVADDVETFTTYQQLMDGIGESDGVVNVVYLHPFGGPDGNKSKAANQWLKVFDASIGRLWSADLTIGWDEIEDMFALNDNRMTTICNKGADIMKAMRKNGVHGYYCTHQESQVDWRILSKIPFSVYMQRAKCKSDRVPDSLDFSRVNSLEPGTGVVCQQMWGGIDFTFEGNPDKWIARVRYDG